MKNHQLTKLEVKCLEAIQLLLGHLRKHPRRVKPVHKVRTGTMIKQFLLPISLLLLSGLYAQAQTGFTSLTATVKDPAGNLYANCVVTANFVNLSNFAPLLNGFALPATTYTTDCDSTATFTLVLPDNNQITQATGTQWQFTVCATTTPGTTLPSPSGQPANPCGRLTITITGASQNITTQLQAVMPSLTAGLALGSNLAFTGNNSSTGTWTFANVISASANPAASGVLRLSSTDSIDWRNNAGSGDSVLSKITVTGVVDTLNWTGPFAAGTLVHNIGSAAQSGFLQMASGDFIAWRNNAGTADIILQKLSSDQLDVSAFAALRAGVLLTSSANPPASGFIRLASGDTIAWRNNANTADISLGKNTSDQVTFAGIRLVDETSAETLTGKNLGGVGPTAPNTGYNRLRANQGTALVTGDFGSLTGWGTTASIAAVLGTDSAFLVSVSSSGTGQTANPTLTFTYHDGAYVSAPVVVCGRGDINSPVAATWTTTGTGTISTALNFIGTPVAGTTYTASCIAIGK